MGSIPTAITITIFSTGSIPCGPTHNLQIAPQLIQIDLSIPNLHRPYFLIDSETTRRLLLCPKPISTLYSVLSTISTTQPLSCATTWWTWAERDRRTLEQHYEHRSIRRGWNGPPFDPSSGLGLIRLEGSPNGRHLLQHLLRLRRLLDQLASPYPHSRSGTWISLTQPPRQTLNAMLYDNKVYIFNTFQSVLIMALTVFSSVFTAVGNGMVLLSFFLERQLRQATNYFIGSLSMTGFLIGIFRYIFAFLRVICCFFFECFFYVLYYRTLYPYF